MMETSCWQAGRPTTIGDPLAVTRVRVVKKDRSSNEGVKLNMSKSTESSGAYSIKLFLRNLRHNGRKLWNF